MISLSLKRFQTLEILFEVQVLNLLTTDDFEPNKLFISFLQIFVQCQSQLNNRKDKRWEKERILEME